MRTGRQVLRNRRFARVCAFDKTLADTVQGIALLPGGLERLTDHARQLDRAATHESGADLAQRAARVRFKFKLLVDVRLLRRRQLVVRVILLLDLRRASTRVLLGRHPEEHRLQLRQIDGHHLSG